MSKIVIDKFDGISSIKRNAGLSMFDENCRDLMPQRDRGYLVPGFSETVRVKSTDGILAGLILDATQEWNNNSTLNQNRLFAIDSGKVYRLADAGQSFSSTGGFPHTVSGGKEVVQYNIKSTNNLMYITATTMGMYNESAFDDDWLSTIPVNASSPGFSTSDIHPKLIWKTYLWIGDGRYVNKLDGQVGANGTYTKQALDLGIEWEITSLFPTNNYIGICAQRKPRPVSLVNDLDSRIFFWDGTSSVHNYSIPIVASKIISSLNLNGTIYLITVRNGVTNLERLTENGSEQIRKLSFNIAGTTRELVVKKNALTEIDNQVIFGGAASSYKNAIYSYGSEIPEVERAFNQLCSSSGAAATVGYVGRFSNLPYIFASYQNGSSYSWTLHYSGYSPNAVYRGNYIDLAQKAVLNYIEVFFKPLVASDSITVGVDSNYGTANTIQQDGGVISYTKDGAITSKKFDLAQIECHSFRPTISWSAGGVAISKIVIDYSFLNT
ncbi:hypothetical protein M0R04_12985 [Candidatus Dojkabacteria bacterium]|jgi:hypothetical protein|nr:hypothetical protein [Candidatus Dojkabacteria bacterium]